MPPHFFQVLKFASTGRLTPVDAMSRLLLIVCLTLGMFIVGCGGEKKDDKKTSDKESGKADTKMVSVKLPNMT